MARSVASTPTTRETRAPHTTRLSRSRPRWSEPSGWPTLSGGARRRLGWVRLGSASGRAGATAATTATNATIKAPTARPRRRRRAGADRVVAADAVASVDMANPRVDHRVEKVGGQVDSHVGGRD